MSDSLCVHMFAVRYDPYVYMRDVFDRTCDSLGVHMLGAISVYRYVMSLITRVTVSVLLGAISVYRYVISLITCVTLCSYVGLRSLLSSRCVIPVYRCVMSVCAEHKCDRCTVWTREGAYCGEWESGAISDVRIG